MVKRVCMVCLPRTGSTFIGEILSEIYGLTNLIEPCNPSVNCLLQCHNGNLSVFYSKNQSDYLTAEERISYFIELLGQITGEQSLLMKLFLVYQTMPFLENILNALRQVGFEFIKIRRRNQEEHLLSMGIAKQTGIWYRQKKTTMCPYKVHVNCNDIIWMNNDRLAFDNRVNEFRIDGPDIWYETAREDLASYTGKVTTFDVNSMVMRLDDQYRQISNADEVRKIIKDLND